MEKTKVMQVLYSGLGGHGSVFFSLVEGDQSEKVNHSALFFGIEVTKPEYLSYCTKHGITAYSVKKQIGLDLASWRKVYSVFKAEKPDVIILHSLNLLAVAYAYQLMHKVSVIVVEHTSLSIKTKAEWLFSGLAMQIAPKVVLLHHEYEQELKRRLGIWYDAAKVSVIGNGINTYKYKPGPNKEDNRTEIVISMISRFSFYKDQRTLILAFRKLLSRFSSAVPLKLRLAGSGETLDEMKELVADLKLTDSVEFTGLLSEEQIIPFLQNTDIYVHSSLGETMCTAVMQAMSVGLPVIGSDIMGINHLMENNVSGILFAVKDHENLAKKLLFLLQHPDEQKRMGENARNYAVNHFSHTRMFSKYFDLFGAEKG